MAPANRPGGVTSNDQNSPARLASATHALALAILGIILLAAVLAMLMPSAPLAAGAVLLFGCLGVLLVNVTRAAQC